MRRARTASFALSRSQLRRRNVPATFLSGYLAVRDPPLPPRLRRDAHGRHLDKTMKFSTGPTAMTSKDLQHYDRTSETNSGPVASQDRQQDRDQRRETRAPCGPARGWAARGI